MGDIERLTGRRRSRGSLPIRRVGLLVLLARAVRGLRSSPDKAAARRARLDRKAEVERLARGRL